MSKLFNRLDSLIKYLKHNGLLDTNYEPFISKTEPDSVIIEEYKKLIAFFDDTNDMFKDVYISFMQIYQQELMDDIKRERAKHAKMKLLQEYCRIHGDDSKPTDQYIYKHVALSNAFKPYMNLSTPYVE